MQEIDDVGFDKLRLGQRRSNAQNRLVREEHGAFRHGVDVSRCTGAELGSLLRQKLSPYSGRAETPP
jgi:hypothetical protein